MTKRLKKICFHIIGCLVFLSFPILFSPDISRGFDLFSIPPFQHEFFCYFLLIIFFYVNYYYLIPKFYYHKKIYYFSLLIPIFLLTTIIPSLIFFTPYDFLPEPMPGGPPAFFWLFGFFRELARFSIVLVLTLLVSVTNKLKQAEKEKLAAELSYLKAQINPHFLFNSLNGIYAMALTQSEETPEAIARLSALMRYILTESNKEWVTLEKELTYIHNYIELQKMRLKGSLVKVLFINEVFTDEQNDSRNKSIAPLLLITLVENAFKHGITNKGECCIKIHVLIEKNSLALYVENSMPEKSSGPYESIGIGTENLRNRLNLIYPNRHSLEMKTENETYYTALKLQLK